MKRKILIIGPSSTHVDRFIGLVIPFYDDVVFIGETDLETSHAIRQYRINFRSMNPFAMVAASKRLKKIIAAENPDHVHIQQVNRVAFIASRVLNAARRKFVATAWGSDVLLIPKQNKFYRWMTRKVLNRAAYITADSTDMIQAIEELAPQKPIELVLFGIDPIVSVPKEKLVYSNRALFPLYNIEGVIDEFIAFHQTSPDWRLVIAGTGPSAVHLKQKVEQAGFSNSIEFCGWLNQEQNDAYYKKASIYISLPLSDGTSVSLLEAMSAGCIPVVADLPVSHEWISDKENGVIKKANENALIVAKNLNQQEVAQQNEKIIAARATKKIAGNKFHQIYQKIASGSVDSK